MEDTDRFQLVNSLYGQGSFIAWLCVMASVLVSWEANPAQARRDSLTNDLFAALAYPLAATADVFRQFTVNREQIRAVSQGMLAYEASPEDLRLLAALEAPLSICEIFVILAPIFIAITASKGLTKRCITFMFPWLLAFSTQIIFFIRAPNVSVEVSYLARPFFLDFLPALVLVAVWQVVVVTAYSIEALCRLLTRTPGGEEGRVDQADNRRLPLLGLKRGRLSGFLAGVTSFIFMFSFLYTKWGWAGNSQQMMRLLLLGAPGRWLRFVPKSNAGAGELDQVVAMLGGIITLLFSIRDAVKEGKRTRGE